MPYDTLRTAAGSLSIGLYSEALRIQPDTLGSDLRTSQAPLQGFHLHLPESARPRVKGPAQIGECYRRPEDQFLATVDLLGRERVKWTAMGSPVLGPEHAAQRAELIRAYSEAINQSRNDQSRFIHSSLVSEGHYAMGPWGLHAEHVDSAVPEWLKNGAPIDGLLRIEYGDAFEHWETPLLTALVDERLKVAAALIRHGADLDAPNFYKDATGTTLAHTAIHMMTARADRTAVNLLVKAGADVNSQTTDGTTAISQAAADDDSNLVAALLRAGADPGVRDFLGRAPVDRAGPLTRLYFS